MSTGDKYGISEAIDWHFSNQGVLEVSDRLFALKSVGAIWEEVYIKMPLKDTDDKDIQSILEAIKRISGESTLKTQLSCGLFQQLKLTLTHGTWYLERSPGGPDTYRCIFRLDGKQSFTEQGTALGKRSC